MYIYNSAIVWLCHTATSQFFYKDFFVNLEIIPFFHPQYFWVFIQILQVFWVLFKKIVYFTDDCAVYYVYISSQRFTWKFYMLLKDTY